MIRFLIWLLQTLPRAWAQRLTRGILWLVWALGIRRRVALENLAIAFPEMSERERRRIARASYLHLGTCAADFLRSGADSDEALLAMVKPRDWEKPAPFIDAKQGFVIATAHLGNFELFGVYAARRKVRLAALTRALKGKSNAGWVGQRTMAGIREIHRGYENLFASVNSGEALGILIDQNMLLKRAIFVPFFGKLAATTPAPAVVAEKTGVPVFLGAMLLDPDGRYRTHFEGPFYWDKGPGERDQKIRAMTALLNDRLEALVRAHPEQWFWIHRRWKTRPPEEAS